jgi:hypothetical protein
MRGVTNGVAVRVHGDVELEPKRGRHSTSKFDRQSFGLAALGSTDPGARDAKLTSELALTDRRCPASRE